MQAVTNVIAGMTPVIFNSSGKEDIILVKGEIMMRSTANKLLGGVGTVLGALMFLALIPSGAALIFSLLTHDRGAGSGSLITFVTDVVFSLVTVVLLEADIAMLALFLTVGRRRGLIPSCGFLFCGLLINMVFAGLCMFLADTSGRFPAIYCLIAGMMFLTSALLLSMGRQRQAQ